MSYLNYESDEDGVLRLVECHIDPADPYTRVTVNSKEVDAKHVTKFLGKFYYRPAGTDYETMMLQQAEREMVSLVQDLSQESKDALEAL